MLKASLLATASVFLIGTASAQNNCNANPDQPFCQGGGEYDDTELRDRILTNEINIDELDLELMRQLNYINQGFGEINSDIQYLNREGLLRGQRIDGLDDRVTQNEIDIDTNRNLIDTLQVENSYIWDDIAYLAERDGDLMREIERVEEDSFMRDELLQDNIDQVDQNVARVEANSIIRDNILADAIDETNETLDAEVLRLDARIDAIVITPYNDEPLWEAVDDLNGRVNLLGDQVTNNTVRIESIERSVEELRDEVNAGLAGVAAMGSIPTALAGQTSVGVGYGNWAGESAFALGASTRSENGRHAFTASGTTTNESTGFSAGYSFSF